MSAPTRPAADLHALQAEWDREAEDQRLQDDLDRYEHVGRTILVPVLVAAVAVLLIICAASQLARVL